MKRVVNEYVKLIRYSLLSSLLAVMTIVFLPGCSEDYPVDEDGLLITKNDVASIDGLGFFLYAVDWTEVITGTKVILHEEGEIRVTVRWGTDLKNLHPSFTTVADCKVEPKVKALEDFSDLNNPRQWTIISGNRKVKKTYTVYITVAPRP